jgi:hypothetical protein
MKGYQCSWAASRCRQRESWGRAALWHAEAEEEKGEKGWWGGGGVGSAHREGEKSGVRRLGTVWRRRALGGPSGRQGTRLVEAVAIQASAT